MSSAAKAGPVRVLFLGGCGEVGRNMIAFEHSGSILVVDVGLSFPNEEMLGVDLVLPDFSYLAERADDCVGVVLTHGHEDHIGALSWFLREVDVPVYGTPLTLGLARRRTEEHEVEFRAVDVEAPGSATIGPFHCRFFAMSHSIPDAISVVIEAGGSRTFYTSDFKLDETPIDGRATDLAGLARVADEGIDLMLSDSTNVEHSGRTPSEALVGPALDEIFQSSARRIVVACFASNLHRIQQVCESALRYGRKVAVVGRSLVANVEVGRSLGHLDVPRDLIIDIEELETHRPEKTVVISTGSQGEPLSALSLIAAGEHKFVRVEPGDSVILSASPIPGNESAVHRVINGLYRAGATVYHPGTMPVHVSGHAAADELSEMLSLMRPRHFVPVHGEYRHLALHARLAERVGIPADRIAVVEDGDVLELSDGTLRRGDRIPAGTRLVDGLGVGDVGPVVLRDRRVLAGDGIVICVVTIDAHTGEVVSGPDLVSRGWVHEETSRDLIEEAADRVAEALESLERERVTDWTAIKKTCRKTLGEFVWEQTRRRPMILPIIMEV